GILRRRLHARTRQDLGPRQVAIRLAHHQGRGKARPQGPRLRAGQGPDRDLCDAQGPGRIRRQAARSRQGRAHGQAGRSRQERHQAGSRQARGFQDGAGEEVKNRCHFFETNSNYHRHGRAEVPGHSMSGTLLPRLEDVDGRSRSGWIDLVEEGARMSSAVSPLAPTDVPDMPAIAGVRLATAAAGIRYKGRTDVLLAVLDQGTSVAGVFTKSKCSSAPVEWCRAKLKGGKARALVVNSGNANAFTGKTGKQSTALTAQVAAKAAGCSESEIFLASTGVIG